MKKELDNCKSQSKTLDSNLDKLKSMSDADFLKGNNLDNLKDKYLDLEFKDLPPIDRGLSEIERKLK